jgi:hypothetical protein
MPIDKMVLDEDQQKKLVARLKEMVDAAEEFHSTWEDLHKIYWQQYFCQPDSETRSFPWRGSSNLFLPLGRVIQDGIMSQLHDAMFANDPVVKVRATRAKSQTKSDILSRFYGEYVTKRVIPFKQVGNDWNFTALLDGTGVCRTRWDRARRLKRTISTTSEPIYGESQPMDMMGLQMSGPPPILAVQERTNENIEIIREAKPVMEIMDMARLRIAPDTIGSLNYPDCPWYYVIKDLTWDELVSRRREGYQNIDDELYAKLSRRSPDDIERLRRENENLSEGTVLNTAPVYEFYMRLVLPAEFQDGEKKVNQKFMDEDGYDEEVIVTYLPSTEKVTRVVPLSRAREDGKRPDIANHYAGGIPFRFYGQGIQSKMRHLNAALNTGTNQLIDYGTLMNMPFYFYVPHLAQLPDLTNITPGQGIPVGDSRGITFPRMSGDMNYFFALTQYIQGYAERDGTIADQNTGRMPEKSANKTAKGMELVMMSQQVNFRRVASLMSEAYKEALYSVHSLYRQYADDDIVFRVTDETGAEFRDETITRKDLDQEVDFEMVLNPDRQADFQVARALFDLTMQIPYIAQNPFAVRAAAKQLYNTIGYASGIRNFDEIWPEAMTQNIVTAQQQQMQQPGMPGQQVSPGPAASPTANMGATSQFPSQAGNVLPMPRRLPMPNVDIIKDEGVEDEIGATLENY